MHVKFKEKLGYTETSVLILKGNSLSLDVSSGIWLLPPSRQVLNLWLGKVNFQVYTTEPSSAIQNFLRNCGYFTFHPNMTYICVQFINQHSLIQQMG